MACVPLQAPEAVQLVAFVDDHVSVLVAPAATEAGLAARLTVGVVLAVTVMVALACAMPPAPLHASV